MKNSELRHYFVSRDHDSSQFFEFKYMFDGAELSFTSSPDVFSKNELDYGSLVLVRAILERSEQFGGKIMDMCCGYGTIAILLSKKISAEYYLSDINTTATKLACINVEKNSTINKANIINSDMFDSINQTFDHVVSNPPIKAGKKTLLKFVDGAYSHLISGGTLTLVIKKNLGESSLRQYLINLFGNCEIWERDKGYYVLHSIK